MTASEDTLIRQAIDYLLGIDTTEHWPVTDPPIPVSPEDYGCLSARMLAAMDEPTTESIAALIHGAIRHEVEYVRVACGDALVDVNRELARTIYVSQSTDPEPMVRENAFERLWHLDGPDFHLAQRIGIRLSGDPDEDVRATAKGYL